MSAGELDMMAVGGGEGLGIRNWPLSKASQSPGVSGSGWPPSIPVQPGFSFLRTDTTS